MHSRPFPAAEVNLLITSGLWMEKSPSNIAA